MSSGTEILKELFVSLGWIHDEQSRKKVVAAEHKTTGELEREAKVRENFAKKGRESLEATLKTFAKYAAAAELMAIGVAASVEKMASSFEKAYYSSSRTGSSVKEMNAFSYAASQMGSSADEAVSALEGLGTAQRKMPGYASMLRAMGATDPNNKAKSLHEIMPWLATQPIAAAEARAQVLGIPEHLLLAMRHPDEFHKFEDESNKKYSRLGFDPDKSAKDGKDLMQSFRSLYDTIQKIGEDSRSGSFEKFRKTLNDLNEFQQAHGQQIADILWKISDALLSILKYIVEHLPALDDFVTSIGGWTKAFEGLFAVFLAERVGRVLSVFSALRGISMLTMPPWALALLGVGTAGALALNEATAPYGEPRAQRGTGMVGLRKHQHDRDEDAGGPWGTVKRWWKHTAPTWAGGDPAPASGGDGGNVAGGGVVGLRRGRGHVSSGGWWTPDRQREAYETLTAGGMPPASAVALISRWKNVESTAAGPDAINKLGAEGIAQWLGGRQIHNRDFHAQLAHVLDEYRTGSGDGAGVKASRALKGAQTDQDAAVAASAYERAEGYSPATGIDAYTNTTLAGMAEVRRNVERAKAMAAARQHLIHLTTGWPGGKGEKFSFGKPLIGLHPYQPLGGGSAADNSKNVNLHQTNHVSVTGVSDPTAAAAQIGARQDRHSSQLLRSMQSAVV